MTFLEYCKKVSPLPLNEYQCEIISAFEKAMEEGKDIEFMPGCRSGRAYLQSVMISAYLEMEKSNHESNNPEV